MGYADGYYYGQGRIICDTSTFSVGDTIRVRSMTDSNKVWNKQVVTVGTALVFTVPCYDYYKICTVQDISGTPTEIGGVYKTVDYGQTLFINVLDKTTLGGIQGILNAHQEGDILVIGDEVPITVGGSPWIMQVGDIDTTNHKVKMVSKNLYSTTIFSPSIDYTNGYITSNARTSAQAFYTNISENDKPYIKLANRQCSPYNGGSYKAFTDYVWLPNQNEISGSGVAATPIYPITQFAIFVTQSNRVKTYQGNAKDWWTCDCNNSDSQYAVGVTGTGEVYSGSFKRTSSNIGILPCFEMSADS